MTKKIIFALVCIWWGWTVIIDFAVVPTVFRIIHDFFNAGELGIALFSKLNFLELLLSSFLVVMAVLSFKQEGQGKLQLNLILAAWMIVIVYFSFLTPKIIQLTSLWKEAELMNKTGIAGISDIQQEHQFYHRIYVGMDSVKLILLSCLIGTEIFKRAKA